MILGAQVTKKFKADRQIQNTVDQIDGLYRANQQGLEEDGLSSTTQAIAEVWYLCY